MNISIKSVLKNIEKLYNERGESYGNSYLDTSENVISEGSLIHTMIQLKNDRIKEIIPKMNSIDDDMEYYEMLSKRNAELIDIATYCIIELALTEGEGE